MLEKKKDFNYFKALMKSGSYALECAKVLHDVLSNYSNVTISEKLKDMHNIEHTADMAKHEMMGHLVKEFIPPIEREDIISLAQKIDDVTDFVEDVLIQLDIFNVKELRPEVLKFTELLVECCNCMNEALNEFQSFKKSKTLQSKIIELNRLEEVGDDLYTNTVRNLYRTSKDPIELQIWADILARLEKCYDACEDVADDIETIIMKNS